MKRQQAGSIGIYVGFEQREGTSGWVDAVHIDQVRELGAYRNVPSGLESSRAAVAGTVRGGERGGRNRRKCRGRSDFGHHNARNLAVRVARHAEHQQSTTVRIRGSGQPRESRVTNTSRSRKREELRIAEA